MLNYIKNLFGNKKETMNQVQMQDMQETSTTTVPTSDTYKKSTRLSEEDLEQCLSQQTKSFQCGSAILVANGKENELFLIHYFSNTFFIVKVAYENNKLNVIYDYRRKSFLLEEFQYRIRKDGVTAMLKLMNSQVEFTVKPKVNYRGECEIIRNQSAMYDEFLGYLNTYRKNINVEAMNRRREKGYLELISAVCKISIPDRQVIFGLLDENKKNEAIKQIQEKTGLGLADCVKIAESPYMYL